MPEPLPPSLPRSLHPPLRDWPLGLAAWAVGWAAMAWLAGRVDLANLAMVLVLASAVASFWLPVVAACGLATVSVAAFNWLFVEPVHSLSVSLSQHTLLLVAMLGVSWIISAVMGRQRALARHAQHQGERVQQLHRFGEALRDSQAPAQQAGLLFASLGALLGTAPRLLVLHGPLPATDEDDTALLLGEPTPHERSGLWQCLRQGTAFGPGTGRHAELREWYFPLRGRQAAFGAAMVPLAPDSLPDADTRAQVQALCDQLGIALQRALAQRQVDAAQAEVQLQSVRNALQAAISHDFRTPLAAILGAASALREQQGRLSQAQQDRLLASIDQECRHLSRLTDNTLQLARLDAPGVTLTLDWESPQELAGAVLARRRARTVHTDGPDRLGLRVDPGTPLVRCDALLMSQLLDNLVDNALKYAPEGPVDLLVRPQAGHVVLAVRDRGPGVAPAWRERIFQVFQRGEDRPAPDGARARSAGVGLAVCRAIAQAHGGELRLRARAHGGASFECWLPQQPVPPIAAEDEADPP
ncbi:MAG: ATP-binding protein [Rhizobacter sp.]